MSLYNDFELRSRRSGNWLTTFNHFNRYCPEAARLSDKKLIKKIEGFKTYLVDLGIKNNSINTYIKNIKTLLNSDKDATATVKIKYLKKEKTERNFIDKVGIEKLIAADCEDKELKAAALFTAFTGLRYSDVDLLNSSNFKTVNGNTTLELIQQKTKKKIQIPLNKKITAILGNRINDDYRTFRLNRGRKETAALKAWLKAAGQDESITFHCFRHSFASNLLSSGVDLITVQNLLGHSDLKTTLIYLHTSKQSKINAVEKL